MNSRAHFEALQNMYAAAPINEIYRPTMKVSDSLAVIEMEVDERFHHSAGGLHGSVYFKMLDDSAFFAANSLETKFFVLTASFTTYLSRPVVRGTLTATGRVVDRTRSQFFAESVLVDEAGEAIGRGNGIFVRGRLPLADAMGYTSDKD